MDVIDRKVKEEQCYKAQLKEALVANVSLIKPTHGNIKEVF